MDATDDEMKSDSDPDYIYVDDDDDDDDIVDDGEVLVVDGEGQVYADDVVPRGRARKSGAHGLGDEEEEPGDGQDANLDPVDALLRKVRSVKLDAKDAKEEEPDTASGLDPDAIENLLKVHQDELIRAINSGVPEYQRKAFQSIAEFAELSTENEAEILNSEFLPMLGTAMQPNVPDIVQYAALSVIVNLVGGPKKHTAAVVEAGFIEPLAALLLNPATPIVPRMKAMHAIANIAHDSRKFRDMLLSQCIIPSLLASFAHYIEADKSRPARMALRCINELVYWSDPDWKQLEPLVDCAMDLLQPHDDKILRESCAIIHSLLAHGLGRVDIVNNMVNAPLCLRLLRLIFYTHSIYMKPAFDCILIICAKGELRALESFVKGSICYRLADFLWQRNDPFRAPAMMVLANLIRYPCFLPEIIEKDLIDSCVTILLTDVNMGCRKEACWVIANAAALKLPEINSGLMSIPDLVPALIVFMEVSHTTDLQATLRALETLFFILSTGDMYLQGGSAQRGASNPFADEMAENQGQVERLMTLYCEISGYGIEGLNESEAVAGEEMDDGGSSAEEDGPLNRASSSSVVRRHVPLKTKVAAMLKQILNKWFRPKVENVLREGQWVSPLTQSSSSSSFGVEDAEMLDMLSGKMQGMKAGV
ncbi:Importin alpha subunit (Karyopherin alpha subunit) (Serine-rich RNA polymerase I suppressor protein) [Borealophlyctis nickersoniae]|nr:Importin alpha subunit (Karyopherin alpha subunit) (Serine-rich RNA polymerase I suppressor protein) [Borealophlyctis nickersoniae]